MFVAVQDITPEELGEVWKGYIYAEHELGPSRASLDHATAADAAAAAPGRSSFEAAAPAATVPAAPAAAPIAAAVPEPTPAPVAPTPAAAAAARPAAVQPPAAAVPPQPSLQSLLPPGMVVQALEHDQWLYKDPSGNQQGPFNRTDILDWAEQGEREVGGGDQAFLLAGSPVMSQMWATRSGFQQGGPQ